MKSSKIKIEENKCEERLEKPVERLTVSSRVSLLKLQGNYCFKNINISIYINECLNE